MAHVRIWGSPGLATTQGHPARRSIFNHKHLCNKVLSTEASLPRGSDERGKEGLSQQVAVGWTVWCGLGAPPGLWWASGESVLLAPQVLVHQELPDSPP